MNQKDLSPKATFSFVKNMGMGWNLGNTFDNLVLKEHDYETGWGNPKVTPELIHFLKKQGFKTIRIPVSWGVRCGPAPSYQIPEKMISRLKEVIQWCMHEDMYVILNMHHESEWIHAATDDYGTFFQKYSAIWKQIAQNFGEFDERLIFESMNEIGFPKLDVDSAADLLNKVNAEFVKIIRDSKFEQNKYRFLLLAGLDTDVDKSLGRIHFPDDSYRCILSIHYYTPSVFTIAEPGTSWGYRSDWGNQEDLEQLKRQFAKLKTGFMNNGMPVILGEFGCLVHSKDSVSRHNYFEAIIKEAVSYGICPIFWDNGEELDRNNLTWRHPDVDEAFVSIHD